MAKKRRSRPKGKKRSRKQSNTGHIVRNTITVIVIIAIIVSLLLYLRDNTSPLPFRANNTPAYTGTAVQGHIASLDRAKTPQNRRSQIIEHKGYTVSYNSQWRLPNWVAYELRDTWRRRTQQPFSCRPQSGRHMSSTQRLHPQRIRPRAHGSGCRYDMGRTSHARIVLHEQHMSSSTRAKYRRMETTRE